MATPEPQRWTQDRVAHEFEDLVCAALLRAVAPYSAFPDYSSRIIGSSILLSRRWRETSIVSFERSGGLVAGAEDDERAVFEVQFGPALLGRAQHVALLGGVLGPAVLHGVVGDV
jgi:hypothetical protein